MLDILFLYLSIGAIILIVATCINTKSFNYRTNIFIALCWPLFLYITAKLTNKGKQKNDTKT